MNQKIQKNFIKNIQKPLYNIYTFLKFKIESEGVTDINLLCVYLWEYQGATQDMELAEFVAGLLDGRFTSQIEINKIYLKIKNGTRNKKNISHSL